MTATAPRETVHFGPLQIAFDARVLQPRPWTLAQATWAADLARVAPAGPVLELCAGVGHIGLAFAALVPRRLVQVDADEIACGYARDNARTAGFAGRVAVRHSDLDTAIAPDERFALVLADPPWVPTHEVGRYPDDPVVAIDGGGDGLDLARRCVQVMERHLLGGGTGVLQLGSRDQAEILAAELDARPRPTLRVGEVRGVTDANGVLVHLAPAVGGCTQAADVSSPPISNACVNVSATGTPRPSSSARGCEPPS